MFVQVNLSMVGLVTDATPIRGGAQGVGLGIGRCPCTAGRLHLESRQSCIFGEEWITLRGADRI